MHCSSKRTNPLVVCGIHTLVSGRVLEIKGANPLDEGLHTSLLEDSHEGGLESLAGIRRHLGNGGLVRGTLLDIAASNLFELEISGNIGGDEDVGQLSRGHEELGNEVDVPVVESAVVLPRLLAGLEVAILFEELNLPRKRSELAVQGGAQRKQTS
jgi:hypothetical protein